MSSAVISTSAAQGRFFILDAECDSGVPCHPERSGKCAKRISRRVEGSLGSANPRLAGITPASHLSIRPAPEMISSGIAALDSLAGGLPRGCLTEILGPASSGRTTILLAILAAATRRGEFCAVVDAGDALDPQSAAAAAIELDRLLWVRCTENSPSSCPSTSLRDCPRFDTEKNKYREAQSRSKHPAEHRLEQLLRVTDLLLEGGGFGLIALDLCDLPPQTARRIPLTTWFRFRRVVEHTPTVLLVIERQSIAGSCSSLLIKLAAENQSLQTPQRSKDSFDPHATAERRKNAPHGVSCGPAIEEEEPALQGRNNPAHARLFTGWEITAEILRSRIERKPPASVATFASKTAWAG